MYLAKDEARTLAGQQIICGFLGQELSAELKEMLREIKPFGLILFARNIESCEQVAELIKAIKSFYKTPLAIAIDQEGGRVARLKQAFTEWPPMRLLGDINDVTFTKRVAFTLGTELRALNIDINFAPVLDVDTNPQNPIIGDRAFSSDPHCAAAHGAAFVEGLQEAGVSACGKHFPGHGDTDKDSHVDLPYVEHDLKRLQTIEWPPFKQAITHNVASIMTAHVMVPKIDAHVPATFSPKILNYLRQDLNFKGVIVSDDLEMHAVALNYSLKDMAELGIKAGIDNFLICNTPSLVFDFYRHLVQVYEQPQVDVLKAKASEKRLLHWQQMYVKNQTLPWQKVVHCQEHQALSELLLKKHSQRA